MIISEDSMLKREKVKEQIVTVVRKSGIAIRTDKIESRIAELEDQNKSGIFNGENISLPKSNDGLTNKWAQKIIYQVVGNKEQCNFLYGKMEDLDHEKHRKSYEDVPSGASHKGEKIIKRIAFTKDHLFSLRWDVFVGRILEQSP